MISNLWANKHYNFPPTLVVNNIPLLNLHEQFKKLWAEEELHPAWHGEKYVKPLLPQTGSTKLLVQEHPKLHQAVKFTLKASGPLPLPTNCPVEAAAIVVPPNELKQNL